MSKKNIRSCKWKWCDKKTQFDLDKFRCFGCELALVKMARRVTTTESRNLFCARFRVSSLDSRVNDNACKIDNSDARRYQLLCESALKLADVSDKIACDLFTKQKSHFFEHLSSILEAREVKIGQNKALEFSKRAVLKCGNIQTGSKKFEFWPIKPIRMCASLLTRNSQGARNSIRAWLKFSVSWHLPAANFAPLLNAFGGGLKLFVL